jgi:hypothetical protein
VSTATVPRHCAPGADDRSLFDDFVGGGPTLEELVASVWEGLAVHGTSPCPVCGAAMEARYGADSRQPDDSSATRSGEAGYRARGRPEAGRCCACGATLS